MLRSSMNVFLPKDDKNFIAPSSLGSPSLENFAVIPSDANSLVMKFQRLMTSFDVYELSVPKAPNTKVGLPEN